MTPGTGVPYLERRLPEAVFLGVRGVDVLGLGVAAVAVVAVHALLEVNVVRQTLGRNVKMEALFVPEVFLPVTLRAQVFVGRKL
jgi:hypothetical protein